MNDKNAKKKTIEFRCPHCGIALRAEEKVFGKDRNCPKCKKQIKVPGQKADA